MSPLNSVYTRSLCGGPASGDRVESLLVSVLKGLLALDFLLNRRYMSAPTEEQSWIPGHYRENAKALSHSLSRSATRLGSRSDQIVDKTFHFNVARLALTLAQDSVHTRSLRSLECAEWARCILLAILAYTVSSRKHGAD